MPASLSGSTTQSGFRMHRDYGGLAVGHDRPRQLLVAEVLRHRDGEDAPMSARQEMRRLSLVGPAGLDPVVRTDRDVEASASRCD